MELNEKNINIESLKQMMKGSHSTQNKIQVGYKGESQVQETRKIGDKWEDADGNEWEQRNGYAVKLGKDWQQELHDYLKSFKNCPKETCTCTMPKRLDEKMKIVHGMCFDCVVQMEHKLRIEGKFEEYEKEKIKNNMLSWIEQAEKDKDYVIEELSKTLEFVNSNGIVEKWENNVDKDELKNKIEEEFEKFKKDMLSKLENYND